MALTFKHNFGTLNDKRVTIVEVGITKERMEFLKNLLEFNRFTVITEEKVAEDADTTYSVGVDDMVFNPMIWVYDRKLKTPDGRYVTHEYWEKGEGITKPQYWEYRYE